MAAVRRFFAVCRDRYYRPRLGLVNDPHRREMHEVQTGRLNLQHEIEQIERERAVVEALRKSLEATPPGGVHVR